MEYCSKCEGMGWLCGVCSKNDSNCHCLEKEILLDCPDCFGLGDRY